MTLTYIVNCPAFLIHAKILHLVGARHGDSFPQSIYQSPPNHHVHEVVQTNAIRAVGSLQRRLREQCFILDSTWWIIPWHSHYWLTPKLQSHHNCRVSCNSPRHRHSLLSQLQWYQALICPDHHKQRVHDLSDHQPATSLLFQCTLHSPPWLPPALPSHQQAVIDNTTMWVMRKGRKAHLIQIYMMHTLACIPKVLQVDSQTQYFLNRKHWSGSGPLLHYFKGKIKGHVCLFEFFLWPLYTMAKSHDHGSSKERTWTLDNEQYVGLQV